MPRLLVPIAALLLASSFFPAYGWSEPLEALRTDLLARDAALSGDLDRAKKKEKKAYGKALDLLDPAKETGNELKVVQKVVRKLKRVCAADASLADTCRTAIDGIGAWVPESIDALQEQSEMGRDGPEKNKARSYLDGMRRALETSRGKLTKQAGGFLKVSKKIRKAIPLVDLIPAPDGTPPLGKRDFKELGIDPNQGGLYLESMFGRWWIENATTGERIEVLLCLLSLEHADERRYGAAGNWNLQQGQMYAFMGRLMEPWGSFANIRSPIFGSPLTAFWTRGLDGEGRYRWFRWTRVTKAPTIEFTHEVTGVDLAYFEGAGDQTVSLDYQIDWSIADPWFANGQCGDMAVVFEFYAENGSGFEWTYQGLAHEAKSIPFTTAEGHYEGRAEFTGDYLWTHRPTRMRLAISYELEDVYRPQPVPMDSVPLTNGK